MIQFLISEDLSFDNIEPLREAALAALEHEKVSLESEISIAIEQDEQLRKLNREYLGIDAPTDVLSFSAGEEEIDPDTGQAYLGDMIISLPRARSQAEKAGHPEINELQLLVVHGTLHLLGYDHATAEEKEDMWKAQREILSKIGCVLNREPGE